MNNLGLRILAVVVLPLLLCFAQEQSPSFDVLDNAQGETPCTVQELVQNQCQSNGNTTNPAPTQCTCNLQFFNIWSACILSSSASPLPQLGAWENNCTTGSIPYVQAIPSGNQGGVQLPTWVNVPVRSDTQTFDVAAAITVADARPSKWTTLQIITPVIAGIFAFTMASAIFFCCQRRRQSSKETLLGLKYCLPFVCKAHKVTESSRQADWDIEGGDKGDLYDEPVQLDEPPLKPMFVDLPLKSSSNKPTPHPSMTRKSHWKKVRPLDWLETGINHVPLPWKRRPQAVKSLARHDRFRVDDFDASTVSSTSIRATIQSSRKTNSEWSGGRSSRRRGSIEGTHSDGRSRGSRRRDEAGERETLISHDERNQNTVFLISSKPGVDFSLESNSSDKASAARSPTSPPPRVTFQTLQPQRTSSPRPRIPPAPKVPVPLPPILTKPPKLQQPQPSRARGSTPPFLAEIPASNSRAKQPTPPPSNRTRHSPPVPNGHRPPPLASSISSPPSTRPNLPRPPLPKVPSQPTLALEVVPPFRDLATTPHLPDNDEPNQPRRNLPTVPSHSSLRSHMRESSIDSQIPHRLDPVMMFPGSVRAAGYSIGTSSRL